MNNAFSTPGVKKYFAFQTPGVGRGLIKQGDFQVKNSIRNNFITFIQLTYSKIFKINDSPQKIALGLGIGIFLGILPGTGPIAAVISASVLRINKASALLGSLLVNTWINIVTFVFAIKIGSAIIGVNWRQIYNKSLEIFSNFRYSSLLKLPVLKLILPTLIGYLIIAFFMGFLAYISAFLILNCNKNRRR